MASSCVQGTMEGGQGGAAKPGGPHQIATRGGGPDLGCRYGDLPIGRPLRGARMTERPNIAADLPYARAVPGCRIQRVTRRAGRRAGHGGRGGRPLWLGQWAAARAASPRTAGGGKRQWRGTMHRAEGRAGKRWWARPAVAGGASDGDKIESGVWAVAWEGGGRPVWGTRIYRAVTEKGRDFPPLLLPFPGNPFRAPSPLTRRVRPPSSARPPLPSLLSPPCQTLLHRASRATNAASTTPTVPTTRPPKMRLSPTTTRPSRAETTTRMTRSQRATRRPAGERLRLNSSRTSPADTSRSPSAKRAS